MPKSVFNQESQDIESIQHIQRKLIKNFEREDMLKCLPIDWKQIAKFKSRVESVLATLSTKAVMREKMLEFKK